MGSPKHNIQRHFGALEIALTKARLLKHDMHFHGTKALIPLFFSKVFFWVGVIKRLVVPRAILSFKGKEVFLNDF